MATLKQLHAIGATRVRHSEWAAGEYVLLSADGSGLDYSLGAGTLVIPLHELALDGWSEYRESFASFHSASRASNIFYDEG